ncbi:hypothetical protein CARUB_v10005612mg [Capsella rubella]|uniref:B box-type domain-containing protein n=1 Tax=Capsella rubella TaxID=81985 RepID=R0F6Z4_9BRAS|nr:zinc finger protein CONSTANS-LIKE 4 [Capsella rubella]EOA17336.1 hypothetical protein CARUB_v10005612mg [Capsella rubella]
MGKKCDLCSGVARMYCESDQASLCWDCDGKVHGANFLVAKHTRCLLCSACQSLTPWKATGLRLGPTFSVCDSCVALKNAPGAGRSVISPEEVDSFDSQEDRIREDGAESYDDGEDEEDDDEEYSDDDEGDVDDDEEAENQVVPWSAAAAAQPPPVMSSSSSSDGGFVTKRTRTMENSDLLCSDDEIGSSSGQESIYSRPLKRSSRDEPVVNSIVRSLKSAVDTSASSSSSFIFATGKTRRDLSR